MKQLLEESQRYSIGTKTKLFTEPRKSTEDQRLSQDIQQKSVHQDHTYGPTKSSTENPPERASSEDEDESSEEEPSENTPASLRVEPSRLSTKPRNSTQGQCVGHDIQQMSIHYVKTQEPSQQSTEDPPQHLKSVSIKPSPSASAAARTKAISESDQRSQLSMTQSMPVRNPPRSSKDPEDDKSQDLNKKKPRR